MNSLEQTTSSQRDALAFAVAHRIVQVLKRIFFFTPLFLLLWLVVDQAPMTAAVVAFLGSYLLEFFLKRSLELA